MKPVQGTRLARFALLASMAALMLGLSASPALASVSINPESPFEVEELTVEVSGTPTGAVASATHVAIVVCNVETGVTPGTRCDKASASGGVEEKLVPVATFKTGVATAVRRGAWDDYNYTKGTPPTKGAGTTTCKNSSGVGDKCAVVVSYYVVEGGGKVTPLNPPSIVPISFL